MTTLQAAPVAPARTTAPAEDAAPQIRLGMARLPRFGPIDGAWWPHSRDTATEVRALVTTLDARSPQYVTRVNVQLAGWDDIPRKLDVGNRELGDHLIRVGWFRSGDPHLVTVVTRDRVTTQLLVIPPQTTEALAATAMATATSGTNTAQPVAILDAGRPVGTSVEPASEAELRWDDEGGSPVPGNRPDQA